MFGTTINQYQYTPATSTTSSTQISADVYARVERQMASQNKGVVKLNDNLTRDQTKLSGLGQLQSALAKFQAIAQNVSGAGLSTAATSSTKGVLNATTTDKAVGGTYSLDVKQLAQGQVLSGGAQKAANSSIGTGAPAVIKIELGTTDGKDFTAGDGKPISITLGSGDNTLEGIAAALKKAGVDASVIKGDAGYSLSINGKSGADNSMRISVTGDAAVKDLLSYSPGAAKGMTQASAAQDALLTVGGKDIKSATNTLTTAITGASIELTGTGQTDVVIAKDASQIASNVTKLVAAYNELNAKMQTLQKGDLKSDTALGQVSSQMQQVLRTASNGVPSSILSAAGVTLGKDGNLLLDDKKLASAVAADPDAVSKMFTNDGKGVADMFASKATTLTSDSSTLRREVTSVNKEITTLTSKKADMAKALTAQATALASLYSQQEASGNSALPGYTGGAQSLFDFMA